MSETTQSEPVFVSANFAPMSREGVQAILDRATSGNPDLSNREFQDVAQTALHLFGVSPTGQLQATCDAQTRRIADLETRLGNAGVKLAGAEQELIAAKQAGAKLEQECDERASAVSKLERQLAESQAHLEEATKPATPAAT